MKAEQTQLPVYPRCRRITVRYSEFQEKVATPLRLGEITVFALKVLNNEGAYEVDLKEWRAPVRGTLPPSR